MQNIKFIILVYFINFYLNQLLGQNIPLLKDTLFCEVDSYILIHEYDLTEETRATRLKMVSGLGDPFTDSNNNYSRVIFINKLSKDTIFNIPCIALTYINIDTNAKLIIGISRITYWNPYNIMILSYAGELLAKKRIDVMEAKLSKKEYERFTNEFEKINISLVNENRIYQENGFFYISFLGTGLKDKDSSAYIFLKKHIIFNHFCPKITSTDKFLCNCFDHKNPFKTLIIQNGVPEVLVLNGFEGNLININLKK